MERFTTTIQVTDLNAFNPNLTYVNDGIDFNRVVDKLAAYEDIGYDPGELQNIINLYSKVYTNQIREWVDAYIDGRLIVLPKNPEPVNPCVGCDTGWGSVSANGKSSSCHDECPRRKEYVRKLSEYRENNHESSSRS